MLALAVGVIFLSSGAFAQIIVDADMGLDDVRALSALIAGEREIELFITVGGLAAPGKGADNLIGLLEQSGC